MSELEYLQKIAENQTGRTTWIAKYKGIKCIAKKIAVDNPEKKAELIKQLQGQVTFSERLSGVDRQQVILFNQMIEDNGAIVFLRDFVDGESLENLLSGRMEWTEAIKWMKSIASIVQRSHDNYHVIHGDLKPANVLQRRNDKSLCIIDWDTMRISEQVESMYNRTRSISDMPGTPEYMSPEQCAGKRCDSQTDVYALGVILYRLLTDAFPFSGSPMQIIAQKQQESLPPFLNRYPTLGVPADLGNLIDDSLQKDQNKRVRNIDEFIERLERIDDDSKAPTPTPIDDRQPPIDTNSGSGTIIIERPIGTRTKDDSSIVIIGPTQSGKTVLAAGLYRSHSADFNVSALDDKTRQYADQIGSFLQSGNWPAATTKNEVIKLLFKLDIKDWTGTRSGIVEFKEYSGEHMRKENYYQEIIGEPEVVLMLFNPGTPWIADTYPNKQFKNPSEKNDAAFHLSEFISQMKGCINFMVSLPSPPAIAVVITAADRLQSDLKPYRERFESVVSEICDALTLNNCTWKRFEVSVCKPLEKQDELDFNPQHIHEPFVWALNRKRTGRILKKGIITAVCLLCVFLLSWALLGYTSTSESKKAGLIDQEIAQLDETSTNRRTVLQQKEYVDKLQEILEKNKSYKFRYKQYEKQYETAKGKLVSKIDKEYIAYLNKLLAEYKKPNPSLKISDIRNQIIDIQKWETSIAESKEQIDILEKQFEDLKIDKSLQEFETSFAEIKKKNDSKKANSLLDNVNGLAICIPKDGDYRERYNKLIKDIKTFIAEGIDKEFEEFANKVNSSSSDAEESLRELDTWCFEKSEHPKFNDAVELVYSKVKNEMDEKIIRCKNSNNQYDFTKLNNLCAAINNSQSKDIKVRLGKFSKAYSNWWDNAEGRKYTIKEIKLKGKSNYEHGGYVTKINGEASTWSDYAKNWGNSWGKLEKDKLNPINYTFSVPITLEPWESYSITIEHSINDTNWKDTSYKDTITLHPVKSGDNNNWCYSTQNYFCVEYTVGGTVFDELVDQYWESY